MQNKMNFILFLFLINKITASQTEDFKKIKEKYDNTTGQGSVPNWSTIMSFFLLLGNTDKVLIYGYEKSPLTNPPEKIEYAFIL